MRKPMRGARYQQIAADVAGKIVSGGYNEGDRIFARSALAVSYGVSPETARRAIALLADLGIVEVVKGSGCTVASKEKAERFRAQFSDYNSVDSLWQSFNVQIERQQKGFQELRETAEKLSEHLERYQYAHPLQPMKMLITSSCRFLGESIGSIQLWQYTGITIVAIEKKNGETVISPGPYATLTEGEEIYFIGPEDSWGRLKRFLYGPGAE